MLSKFSYNCKELRLRNRIRSRIEQLEFQKEALSINNPLELSVFNTVVSDLLGMLNRLDNNSVICNSIIYDEILASINKYPKTIKEHSELLFNKYIPKSDSQLNELIRFEKVIKDNSNKLLIKLYNQKKAEYDFLQEVKKSLRVSCLESRKSELLFRLINEMHFRKDWFVVFNTLTVSPQNTNLVFSKGSTEWTDYVRSIDRAVGFSVYPHLDWREILLRRKNDEEFHTYFAVVEEGEKHGKLHIHVVHFMKKLPLGCSDPNAGLLIPCKREIDYIKSFWKHGFSSPIAVRFNNHDAYSKSGWKWCCEMIDGSWKSIPLGSYEKLGNYVAKYLVKRYSVSNYQKERMVFLWRVRLSRNLGLNLVKELMKRLSDNQLNLMMNLKIPLKKKLMGRKIPLNLINLLSIREYLSRMKISNPSLLWDVLVMLKPLPSLTQRLRHMIEMKCESNLPNYGITEMLNMSVTEDSSLQKIFDDLNFDYSNKYLDNVCGNGNKI